MIQPENQSSRLRLLPQSALIKTNSVDLAEWNYRPLLGTIQRLRFKLVRDLLAGHRYHRLLEIGYGSGIFMPELARHADYLFGIDPHDHPQQVAVTLSNHGIAADLACGSAMNLPYEDNFFDAIVAVSALEFIPDLDAACRELRRVLTPNGVFIVVTPGASPLLDLGLKLLTGRSAAEDFGARRRMILPTLMNHFRVQQRKDTPPVLHPLIRLYTALRLDTGLTEIPSNNPEFAAQSLPIAQARGYHPDPEVGAA